MHFFVNSKYIASALLEFKRAGINQAVIRATSSRSIELSGFVQPKESWGTAVQLWVNVPLSRDTEAAACDAVMVRLKELIGIPTGEVEINADYFGFFVNRALHHKAIVECPPAFKKGMPGLDWDNSAGVNVKHKDCRAIAWVMRAMCSTEELCKRGFDRICIRDGVAEATDGKRAHRANLSFGSPEMLVPAVMAGLMSRQPGTLNFRADDEQEFAEYRTGAIRMCTVRLIGGAWPDFDKLIPYGSPSVTIMGARVLGHVKAVVDGYKAATVRLSAGHGKRHLIVEGLEIISPILPPFDALVKSGEMRRETETLEAPCPFDNFGMGSEYNASYLVDALAGFDGYARMYYADEDAPLILDNETGRVAIVMPLA